MAHVAPTVNGPRSMRQANLQGKLSGNGTGQAEGTLKSMATGGLEKEMKAKAEVGGGFKFGLGLTGLSLTGNAKYDGGVDSKTKVQGAAEVEGAGKGMGEGEGQTSDKGGFLFPNMLSLLGRVAPESNEEDLYRVRRQLGEKEELYFQF